MSLARDSNRAFSTSTRAPKGRTPAAAERRRPSTSRRTQAPEACASTSSATAAGQTTVAPPHSPKAGRPRLSRRSDEVPESTNPSLALERYRGFESDSGRRSLTVRRPSLGAFGTFVCRSRVVHLTVPPRGCAGRISLPHGLAPAIAAPLRPRSVEVEAVPNAPQASGPGLGRERVRDALPHLLSLPLQADRVRRRGARCDLADDARPGRAWRGGRVVVPAGGVPEARRLDDALGDRRPGLRLDAADLPLRAAHRRHSLLAAARDHPSAPLARPGAADARDHTLRVRHRPVRGGAGRPRLPPGRWPGAGQRRRRRTPGPGRRRSPAGPALRARPARQGPVPCGPAGGLRLLDGDLPLPPRQPDRRLTTRLRLHLVGRRRVEAQPPLPVRRLGDDQQYAMEPV